MTLVPVVPVVPVVPHSADHDLQVMIDALGDAELMIMEILNAGDGAT